MSIANTPASVAIREALNANAANARRLQEEAAAKGFAVEVAADLEPIEHEFIPGDAFEDDLPPDCPPMDCVLKDYTEEAWRVEPAAKPVKPPPERLSDVGNARRFVRLHGQDLRFCHPWGTWLIWDGTRWAPDETGETMRRARDVAADLFREAASSAHDSREALGRWALKSETAERLRALVSLASTEPGIPVLPSQLDGDPWQLNCRNGTVDLRTGQLLPHERSGLHTKICPVEYHPGEANCPAWLQTLDGVFGGDQALIDYVQRFLGYALTGDVREQSLGVWWGGGSNGKSTILGTVLKLLGDYSVQVPSDLFMEQKSDGHPTMLATLAGKRFAVASESGDGRRLGESTIKALTGGDEISCRRMRENYWTFRPTHKLVLGTNHKPTVRGCDHGVWRRLQLVPFVKRFWDPAKGETGPPELEADKGLPEKLAAESSAILNWLVQGCLSWQRDGLQLPEAVRAATAEYRSAQDILGTFLADRCIVGEGQCVRSSDLREEYEDWCRETGERPASNRKVGDYLAEIGVTKRRSSGLWYHGVGLAAELGPK